ncbi:MULTISPECIES: helix-turn-helix domain-containing protein [unclassified Streptomyces]|uniref:helix-turn-helix domain-containing protein n=1 Tax=unclassified Streptomyces TaxID=2593676 RepID=UPI00081EB77B|nr:MULTISPECIES: helix-turn-helix domain-containing protein [unclassified Streptomyces]MYZ38772.1 helix-turn-helix domain-containing protein [Streptomyces sp. SID4917]SCG00290.1 DNA-binding transcriptional regulator, XRE-family HTH domain [Streptomyces sp. MnatMP-M17]
MTSRRRRFTDRRKACGFSQEEFAEAVGVDRSTVQRWENGKNDPQPWQRPKIAKALAVTADNLDALLVPDAYVPPRSPGAWLAVPPPSSDDEFDALELTRRVSASDAGKETLSRLESSFDDLAMRYPASPPQELLERVRKHSAYVAHLMDARMTLGEQRRLHVVGGWFQLLGATLHIDLNQEHAATARLQAAATLAQHAEHREIEAWCYETDAWRVLTDGDYGRALQLSEIAQELAPAGTSVAIQATAQEGRARARLGEGSKTYAAIDRVQRMSAALVPRKGVEHHYQYDPGKSLAYTATTLAWVGDPAAEKYAREVIARLAPAHDFEKWPRRVASANIDLALALLANDRLDEACDAAQRAILSGRVVPSNHWRALEVVRAVERRQLPEALDLREAYQGLKALPSGDGRSPR